MARYISLIHVAVGGAPTYRVIAGWPNRTFIFVGCGAITFATFRFPGTATER